MSRKYDILVMAAAVAIGLLGQPSRARAAANASHTVTAAGTVNEVETIAVSPNVVALLPVGDQSGGKHYNLSNSTAPQTLTITANLTSTIQFHVDSTTFLMDNVNYPNKGYKLPCLISLTAAGTLPNYDQLAEDGIVYALSGQNTYSFGVIYTVAYADWIGVPGGDYSGEAKLTVISNH